MIRKDKLLSFAILMCNLSLSAQFSFDNYALHNLNVVDVNSKEILEDYTIVIHHDKIDQILPSSDYISDDSTQSIVLKGKYVVPGLIDAHVHFATDPTSERRDNAEKVLEEMLLSGITSVRDMAGDARALASLSRNALVGDIDAPNIYYSSLMAGPEFFTDPRTIATAQGGVSGQMPYMKSIDSMSNISLEVAQAIGTGASGIKLYANLSNQDILRIVGEAKKQDIPVWAHAALRPTKPSKVISSGVIAISHANMLLEEKYMSNEDLIKTWTSHVPGSEDDVFWEEEFNKLDFSDLYTLMIKHNVVLDATITVWETLKEELPSYQWLYEMATRITREAHKNGVLVAAGSDSDQATFVQHEMKLLGEECGLSPMDVLVSATKHSAMATGILASEGTIEVGKKANLLLVNSDPTVEFDKIDDVFLVIKNGKLYNGR